MTEILRIMFEFFKTGLFAVGGGMATIPFLEEMGRHYGWFTMEDLSVMIAVSESTPGPIGINMATYVGYTLKQVSGALLATLSLVAPSIIVICIIANYFQKFKDAKLVKMIFAGLKPAVVAFISTACLSLFISTLFYADALAQWDIGRLWNWKCILLLLVLVGFRQKYPKVHPIAFIVGSAVAGVIFSF